MDFGNAAMLTFTVFVLVELINQLFPGLEGRWKVIAALAAGQTTAISVANSDWGVKQVIDGIRLDMMNGFSLFLVGLALAGLAVGFNVLVRKGLANIGENRPGTP